LFVVSGDWFINRLDGQRVMAIQANLPRDAGRSYLSQVGFLDRTGQWWMLTTRGLHRFASVNRLQQMAQARPSAVYTQRDGLSNNDLFRLFEDRRGDLWISTKDFTGLPLTRWDRATGRFHRSTAADGLPRGNLPIGFAEDRAGALWIGFYSGGLARYRDGRFMFLTVADGVPAGGILALHLDHAGRLWMAANQGGLGRLDDPAAERPRFVRYTTADGLASNNVRCITEDRWGRLYIGTARGVDQLDPTTGGIKHYTMADGLANDFIDVAFRDRQGRLWFGTRTGLSRLIPEPDRPPSPPLIWIGGLRIRGVPQAMSELGETDVPGLELGPNENQLQIDFFSLGFSLGEVMRYQYKLEGADEDWSAPTDQRTVNYASLSPGAYRFLVRAVNAAGLHSPTPATVAFRILPPVWQRWWFLTLMTVMIGLVGYAIHRYRVTRLLELERVRTRIAADLHDDIGSSLSRMAILSEVVKQRVAAASPESGQMLTHIAGMARELVDTMSDTVWSIDPRRDNLNTLILRIGRFASDVLDAKGIAYHVQSPPEPEKVKLTPEQRRHLFLIVKEAINNIMRHADCRSVWLTITIADHQLIAEIRDDGRGFTPAEQGDAEKPIRGGHGLENVRARAAALGGQLQIESAPGKGTQVKLVVPLK
jgi:signal transduction histidine kinase